MTVLENFEMGAQLAQNQQTFGKNLELVYQLFPRLKERKRQQAQTLSGGERQMLAIGRGLMADPKLLMLDEPSLGLAPKVVKSILQILAEIHRQRQTTILLAEQNIYHALQVTQRGYVLENGRVVMENASEVLLQSDHIKRNYLGL